MPPRTKKPSPKSTGLLPDEIAGARPPAAVARLGEQIEQEDGRVLASYRDPLGGHWLVLAALPIDRIRPTPFQRELSEAHTKRLVGVIPKVGRFLDPLIAVRAEPRSGDDDDGDGDGDGDGEEAGGFWTPNGMHRLAAMKALGARSVVALVVPEVELAYRILALNTEKAHNLKDKSLEVVRMADTLAAHPQEGKRPESDWAFEFEEPGYLVVGRAYEARPRYSGGAYMPVVRRCVSFLDQPIREAVEVRRAQAERLLELDDRVGELVAALKEAGLRSAYLKPFVVARLNPLRFAPARAAAGGAAEKGAGKGKGKGKARGAKGDGEAAAALPDLEETIDRMLARADKFDASKVRPQDLAAMGGAPPEPED